MKRAADNMSVTSGGFEAISAEHEESWSHLKRVFWCDKCALSHSQRDSPSWKMKHEGCDPLLNRPSLRPAGFRVHLETVTRGARRQFEDLESQCFPDVHAEVHAQTCSTGACLISMDISVYLK